MVRRRWKDLGAVSSANLGPEDKGVAAVEGDSWLDED
jgi:hypothetical protein